MSHDTAASVTNLLLQNSEITETNARVRGTFVEAMPANANAVHAYKEMPTAVSNAKMKDLLKNVALFIDWFTNPDQSANPPAGLQKCLPALAIGQAIKSVGHASLRASQYNDISAAHKIFLQAEKKASETERTAIINTLSRSQGIAYAGLLHAVWPVAITLTVIDAITSSNENDMKKITTKDWNVVYKACLKLLLTNPTKPLDATVIAQELSTADCRVILGATKKDTDAANASHVPIDLERSSFFNVFADPVFVFNEPKEAAPPATAKVVADSGVLDHAKQNHNTRNFTKAGGHDRHERFNQERHSDRHPKRKMGCEKCKKFLTLSSSKGHEESTYITRNMDKHSTDTCARFALTSIDEIIEGIEPASGEKFKKAKSFFSRR